MSSAAGMDPDTCDAVELVTSELVTNAVLHGRSQLRLSRRVTAEQVVVETGDGDPATWWHCACRPGTRDHHHYTQQLPGSQLPASAHRPAGSPVHTTAWAPRHGHHGMGTTAWALRLRQMSADAPSGAKELR